MTWVFSASSNLILATHLHKLRSFATGRNEESCLGAISYRLSRIAYTAPPPQLFPQIRAVLYNIRPNGPAPAPSPPQLQHRTYTNIPYCTVHTREPMEGGGLCMYFQILPLNIFGFFAHLYSRTMYT
jgi:hypothetical protein